jgi:hypothetical protein
MEEPDDDVLHVWDQAAEGGRRRSNRDKLPWLNLRSGRRKTHQPTPFTKETPLKKAPKKSLKLEIHRETLRALEQPQLLAGIVGGYNYSTFNHCTYNNTCVC